MEGILIFLIGAVGYCALELAWRDVTHWSMAIAGGICFSFLYYSNLFWQDWYFWQRCFAQCLFITLLEYVVGCIVNLQFGWQVWDYSNSRLHMQGQISLHSSAAWFLLCVFLYPLCVILQTVLPYLA